MHPISILEFSIIKTLKESETFALSFFRALIELQLLEQALVIEEQLRRAAYLNLTQDPPSSHGT